MTNEEKMRDLIKQTSALTNKFRTERVREVRKKAVILKLERFQLEILEELNRAVLSGVYHRIDEALLIAEEEIC